jgi:hypothetical protein
VSANVMATIVTRRAGRLASRTSIRGRAALESESAKNRDSDVLRERF